MDLGFSALVLVICSVLGFDGLVFRGSLCFKVWPGFVNFRVWWDLFFGILCVLGFGGLVSGFACFRVG